MTLQEFQRLKSEIESDKRQLDRAEGERNAKLAQLKKLGCKSVAEANVILSALTSKRNSLAKKLERGEAVWKERFGEKVDE